MRAEIATRAMPGDAQMPPARRRPPAPRRLPAARLPRVLPPSGMPVGMYARRQKEVQCYSEVPAQRQNR